MTTVTENDLKELKDLILQLSNRINLQNEQVNQKLNDLKVEVAIVKEGLNGVNKRMDDWKPAITKATDKADAVSQKITDLSEKVGELKNWRQVAIIIITGLLTTLFWLLRDGQM